MKPFNFTRAVGIAVVFAITLLGMITQAEAHAGNSSTNVIHACSGNVLGLTRIVGVNGTCTPLESAQHWAIVGPTGATGPAGAIGPAGAVGAIGPAGPAGAQGPVGATGPQGPPAPAGATYVLGDTGPNGGKVYYVDGSGEHGLEAQAADEPTKLNWADAITAASAYGPGWHLPTKTELELLYEQKNIVGGFGSGSACCWSSTEFNANNAWAENFANGDQLILSTFTTVRVRVVRAF